MKGRHHTLEQAVRKLREGERLLNSGQALGLVLRELEITESTWNRWRSTYGGMKADQVKELRAENARLKKLLAEAELDKAMLKDLAAGTWRPRTGGGPRLRGSWTGSGCQSAALVGWWARTARRSAAYRQRARTLTRSTGSGCASSRGRIRVGGGARLTRWPPEKAVW